MNILLSAKGDDATAWRAVDDFSAAYRQTLLDQAASRYHNGSETVFSESVAALESSIVMHRKLMLELNRQIDDITKTTSSRRRKEISSAFYSNLYRHFEQFCSVSVFYQLSMAFLQNFSAAIITQATNELGLFARHLPEISLVAVGPAGRCEYSCFTPLQLLLVHGEVPATHRQTINLFSHTLHAGFEDAGVHIDPVITPRNPDWRGTLPEWQQRCEEGQYLPGDDALIDLSRLIDQHPLHPVDGLSRELLQTCRSALSRNRMVKTNLIERMSSLSNGLGLMGRLKLERSGIGRGLFNLLDHGLLPFTAAVSALALIKHTLPAGCCERIYDLLKRRELDVERAERMLTTWYNLNTIRLLHEQTLKIDQISDHSLFINPLEMTVEQQQLLKKDLESVALIQRHVGIIFSGMEE
jgi:signal-transduction protein with cAMP-binding, CBS, and nucleotidyltransferase domain